MRDALFRVRVVVPLAAALLHGCMSYGGFPRTDPAAPRPAPAADHAFSVWHSTFFGGQEALRDALEKGSPYGSGTPVTGPPERGLYVVANIQPIPASPFAMLGTRMSLWTLTALPAWSTRDGYRVVFEMQRDGAPAGTFTYETRRRTFIWLPLLPLVWVNLYTTSEEEAFRAIANQFFVDAQAVFAAAAAQPARPGP